MATRRISFVLDVDTKGVAKGSRKASREAGKMTRSLNAANKSTAGVTAGLSKLSAVVGGLAIGATVARQFSKAIQLGKEFEASLADLEAITGIAGDRLEWLSERAKETSSEFGTAASDVVEAQKLVASQLAESIDFSTMEGTKELQNITREAIVLQKAAGVDLKTAVEASTTAINQFGLEASDSNRVINNMAAGAKFGAAELRDQAEALRTSGVAADGANLSLEETQAAIQVLAQNGIKGSRAGTQLKNVFTIMTAEAEKLRKVGLEPVNFQNQSLAEGLEQLAPLLENDSQLLEVFGRETLNGARALLRGSDSVAEFTDKVTGTDIATEQASIKMDTFQGASARLAETYNNQLISAFQETNGVGVQLLNTMTELVGVTGDAIASVNDSLTETQRLNAVTSGDGIFGLGGSNIRDAQQFLDQLDGSSKQVSTTIKDLAANASAAAESISGAGGLSNASETQINIYDKYLGRLKGVAQGLRAQRQQLLEEQSSTEEGTAAWNRRQLELKNNKEQLDQVGQALSDVNSLVAEETEKVKESNKEQQKSSKENKETTEQYKNRKEEIQALLEQEGKLTDEQRERLVVLIKRRKELQRLIEKRKIAAQMEATQQQRDAAQPEGAVDVGFTTDTGDGGGQQAQAISQEKELAKAKRQTWLETKKAKSAEEDFVTTALKGTGDATQAQEQFAQATGQAAGNAILAADSFEEAAGRIIEAIAQQIIALWVKNALQTAGASGPLALALSPVLAAVAVKAARGLLGAVGIEYLEGGIVSGQTGGSGLTSRGKKIISINEDDRPEFIVNAESTKRALPLLEAINDNPRLGERLTRGEAGFQTGGMVGRRSGMSMGNMEGLLGSISEAVRVGAERAKITAPVDLRRFDSEKSSYDSIEREIGNK